VSNGQTCPGDFCAYVISDKTLTVTTKEIATDEDYIRRVIEHFPLYCKIKVHRTKAAIASADEELKVKRKYLMIGRAIYHS
jgi:hypothetical protein